MDNILSNKIDVLDGFNTSVIAKDIAKRMKSKRLLLNLTQEDLAQRSGVSYGSLKRFENQYKISLSNLLQIALALDGLDEFNNIFSENEYSSIDELLDKRKMKKRKRARNVR